MRAARSVLPTDLLALVTYNGRSYPNQAWTRERLGAPTGGSLGLGAALDQFLGFTHGRSAWISVHRQRLEGLVGARQRGGRSAWEIDYLVDATADLDAGPGLLDCAVAQAGRRGAERIFLRLAAGSDLFPMVRDAGFIAYREETLYVCDAPFAGRDLAVRPLVAADSYPLFRLYSLATPEAVRRNEAANLSEWNAAQERNWFRQGVQLVREQNNTVDALVRAARLAQRVEIEVIAAETQDSLVAGLIGSAMHALGMPDLPVFILAGRDSGLPASLAALGFSACGDFVSLVKRTTRPVALPNLKPALAKTAIGV